MRNLEIMGEAVKNIPSKLEENHPEVKRREIARMREKVSHGALLGGISFPPN